ncbi:MAG: elongation factor G [Eubacteriales bacterium]|nr:elongation factor G [Sarcina sp.]MBR2729899.1 elongation factor G [Lachnospiraceae bacterium]MDO4417089.1 elongation factor G [Eubacteriales bacterium]
MKVYATDQIRNVVLLGHGGAGKTTLAEAMCLLSGITTRMGKVEDGNSVSDYTKEEQKRGFSIKTSLIPIEWKGCKINILDTPGYFDFVGEVEEAISVADAAVIVVSGKAGVEVGAERAWDLCEKYNIPRMFYISDMDLEHTSYPNTVDALKELYGPKIVPFNFAIEEGGKHVGAVNVISQKGFKWGPKDASECPVPDDCADNLETYREALMETVAETNEEFMERYFGGDEFTVEEIADAVKANIQDCSVVPVECGASTQCFGVYTVLDDIVSYLPAPSARKVAGKNMKSGEEFVAAFDDAQAKSAFIFKTIVDPFIGRYSLIKIRSGVFKTDETVYDSSLESEMRLGKLYIMVGNKTSEIAELHAGDIGAVAKLGDAKTGDTLSTKAEPIEYPQMDISTPYTYIRYNAKNKNDIDKIAQAMAKISSEDLTFKMVNDSENRQTLIYGVGDMQLEVVKSMLKNEYKVEIETTDPKVAYRETIRKNSDVDSKYKKQSGGHGQYGHVKIKFAPSGNLEEAYEFDEEVVGGSVPKNYFPAVEKGIAETVQKGPLAAYPVVGLKATLYDGSYHPVDSSEMAFKTAASQAVKKGIMEAGPVLLEPIVSLKVTIPDSYTGDVMGDLNKRRGRVLGMNPIGNGKQVVEAEVPMSELFDYCTVLRSMTGGRGDYEYAFARYEQTPADVQAKEVAARAAAVAEGADD